MNKKRLFLLGLVFVLATVAACAPAPAPTTVPTPIPPTVAPAALPPTAVPPTAVPPTAVPATAAPAATFDLKTVVDKYVTGLPDGFGGIQPAALKDQIAAAKPFLLDVREASELSTNGFIEGAVNLPIRTLTKNLDKLPAKDQPIVVYCAVGQRGGIAMAALQILGYTNVKNLVGGFNAWKAANLPVVTGTPAAPTAGKAPDIDKDLLAAIDKYVTGLPDGYGGVQPAALKDQMAAAKPFLLDVREASEITTNGKLEGSTNVPLRTLTKNLDKLPQDKAAPIVVYCAVGQRGDIGMVTLQLLGYTNVKNLVGGFTAWKAANLPIAGAPAAPAAAFDIKPVVDKYISNLPDGFGTIAPAALKDQLAAAKPFILDVREASEITSNGFIEGAVNIPMRTLTKNLDKLPAKDQSIVVYCAIGHRGAVAMMTLQLLGYTNVKSLAGGFTAWKAANLPTVTGTPAAPVAGKAPDVDKDLLAALDKYVSNMPDNFYTIAAAALNDQMAAAKPFLLDVREASEITSNGAIAGAVNIPIRTTFKSLTQLPQDKAAPIVVYCAIGHRGAMDMMALQLVGYTNVKSLVGGFNAWKTANLPVAK